MARDELASVRTSEGHGLLEPAPRVQVDHTLGVTLGEDGGDGRTILSLQSKVELISCTAYPGLWVYDLSVNSYL